MTIPRERIDVEACCGTLALLALAMALAWAVGCDSNSNPMGPESLGPGPEALVVTEPVPLVFESEAPVVGGDHAATWAPALSTATAHAADPDGPRFAFVSFQPGTYPEGDFVGIRNVVTGQLISAPMLNGGLDPIGIPAEVGDAIEIRVFQGIQLLAAFERTTPKGLPPKIVRSDPPDRKTKVPLNSAMEVIFTEPLLLKSLTQESFRLELNGEPVTGTIGLVAGGVGVTFKPASSLRYNSEYTIVVGPGVADLSGETLETTFLSTFRTVEFPDPLPGKIAFEGYATGHAEIYTMNPDGSGVVQVTDSVNGSFSMAPALSPDGSKVAFSVAVLETGHGGGVVSDFEIYTADVDGTGAFNVTNHPEFDGWRPAWSPDGTKLAFSSTRGDPANADIYIINVDGTDLQRLTVDPGDDISPAWSPDGSRIAFASNRDGDYDIYVMNLEGTVVAQLTRGSAREEWPAWSPDGSRIAFASNWEGIMHVVVTNEDGSNGKKLTGLSLPGTLPNWSPDGAWIAYDCAGICVMRADGSGPMKVSDGMFPSWSW